LVFQAATKQEDENVITNGGRVLCVTSYGTDISEAVDTSLDMLDNIHFENIYYRTDIGYEFRSPAPLKEF
jgi:phosphoribosylamine--glycine ligase